VSVTGGHAILTYNDTTPAVWLDLIQMQGELGAVSRMELNTTNDIEDRTKMVIGRVVSNPVDPSSLIFTVDTDTLPSDTLTDVTKIINPQSSRPGSGLDPQMLGQRYLITEDISPDYVEWGISANADDIIQYDGAQWTVVFDSQSVSSQEWLHNEYTNKQYTWTGDQWISSHEGVYNPGYWRLIL
jgi:hypothetical protein